jgi:hypothetical protein
VRLTATRLAGRAECWRPAAFLSLLRHSLGDAMAEGLGVVATPELLSRQLGGDDRVIVIASDGVWEFITSQVSGEQIGVHARSCLVCDERANNIL